MLVQLCERPTPDRVREVKLVLEVLNLEDFLSKIAVAVDGVPPCSRIKSLQDRHIADLNFCEAGK